MHNLESFGEICRQNKIRITPQRTAIFNELLKDRTHPSADVVYKKIRHRFANMSFDTVYRTLLSFADMGLVRVVEGYGEPKRFDTHLGPHHHRRCLKCGSIADFENSEYERIAVPSEVQKKFKVTGKRVVLEGYCKKCQKSGSSK